MEELCSGWLWALGLVSIARMKDGVRHYPQQPGLKGGGTSPGRRLKLRQDSGRRSGRGLHGACPQRQSPAKGQEPHHYPHMPWGVQGKSSTDYELRGGTSPDFPCQQPDQCCEPVKKA